MAGVVWTANGVGVCKAQGNQTSPKIAADGQGGAIVVWEDRRSGNWDIYASRFFNFQVGSNAVALPLWWQDGKPEIPVCKALGSQTNPQLVSDGAGGAVIAWEDCRTGHSTIYAQKFDPVGHALWTANGVQFGGPEADWTMTSMSDLQMTTDGAGGAIVACHASSNIDDLILTERFDANGNSVFLEHHGGFFGPWGNIVNYYQEADSPRIVSDGSGGAIITWISDKQVWGNHVNEISEERWNSVYGREIGAGNHVIGWDSQCMIPDGSGGAFFSWTDGRKGNPNDGDVYAQRVNCCGNRVWTDGGKRLSSSTGHECLSVVASDNAGGAIIAFMSSNSGPNIFAQRLDGSGNCKWGSAGKSVCSNSGIQLFPKIAPDGAGGAFVTWADCRNDLADVYAQRISSAGAGSLTANGISIATAPKYQTLPEIAFVWSKNSSGKFKTNAIITWRDNRNDTSQSGEGVFDIYAQQVSHSWLTGKAGVAFNGATLKPIELRRSIRTR